MNSLMITHPHLIEEWDFGKNNEDGISPESITYGSGQHVFWKCKLKQHSWKRSITDRTLKGYNCPDCKNLRNGSFAVNNPYVLNFWNFEKNIGIDPYKIANHYKNKVFWKCDNGHEWEQSPGGVISKEEPCKICNKVKNGSLLSLYPHVADGLHPTKNRNVDPQWLAPRSNERFIWICKDGHEWEAPVNRVSQNGLSCPKCPKAQKREKHPTIADSEFMKFWDVEKNASESINPEKLRLGSNTKAYWKCDNSHNWFMRISLFTTQKKECPDCLIGLKTDGGYLRHPKLDIGNPLVASEWHPRLNGEFSPSDVSTASGKRVWWLCEAGHEWQNSISNRTVINQGCKICENVKNGNVFDSSVISEWDCEKNAGIDPRDISISSRDKYWWKCQKNVTHSWKTSASTRIISNHGCPKCSDLRNGTLLDNFPEVAQQWSKKNEKSADEYAGRSKKKVLWECNNGHTWSSAIDNRTGLNSGCPDCNPQFSKGEKELVDFLKSYNIDVEENRRDLLPGTKLELDIYIPEKKIAIEFNGVYWHSEKFGKDKHYHKNKVDLCEEQGIRLIQVWEDDWVFRKEIVKAGLLHRLGISSQDRIPARKMQVEFVNSNIAKEFLNSYHIQGFASGSVYLALFAKDELLFTEPYAVIAFTIRGDEAYLDRFATRAIIPGGFTKLSKAAEAFFNEQGVVKKMITFADRSLSQGNLYESNGWIVDKELAPDYSYLVDGERKHKFGYRLKRFKNDPNLKYDPTMTEKQLAELNNIPRVWDSGKIRYIKYV